MKNVNEFNPSTSRTKLSLRNALVASFVVQMIAAVGLTGWLSFRNGQSSVNVLVNQLSDEVTARVEKHVKSFADTPDQFLKINRAAIQANFLDLNDYSALSRYFWEQVNISEAVPYIYFGSPEGDFVGVWRESETLTTLRIRTGDTAPMRDIFELDSNGNPLTLLREEDYDPRSRPWYQEAIAAGESTWSSIYVFANPPQLGITHVLPVYEENAQNLLGVLAVDLTLSDISNFLRQLDVSETGQIFIIERDGNIIASSAEESSFIQDADGEKRLAVQQSQNPLIQAVSLNMLERFGSFDQIHSSERFMVHPDGSPTFVHVTPIQDGRGLDWLMIVVLPQSDFTEQIDINTRNTLILCGIALAIAILSGVATSRWIASPVVRIARASDNLAQGNLDQVVNPSIISEIDSLAQSFNQMSGSLMTSFDALHQSEATNRAIIETIPDLMIRAKGDGTYLEIIGNERLQRGESGQQFSSGNTVAESLPLDLAKLRMHYIQSALETGQLQVYEHELLFDGEPQDEEVRILVLGEDEVLIMVRDISARKQAEKALEQVNQDLEYKVKQRTASLATSNRELRKTLDALRATQLDLQKAKEKAESANRAKSEFLANMSHELRTPLNSIIGFAQILSKDDSIAVDQQQRLSIINRSGEHLLSLINNILEMSKIEAGQATLNEKNFDLHAIFQEMEGMFSLKVQNKGLQFILEFAENLPKYIVADEGKLRQILINIIGNAIKFTEQGTVLLRVRINEVLDSPTSSESQYQLNIDVEDTGFGIAPEEMDRLFLPFEQTMSGQKVRHGTGLGLSITQKFIQLMGGQVFVNSEVGEGTQFHVKLPIQLPDGDTFNLQLGRADQISKNVIGLAPGQPNYRILVVDDEADNRLVLMDLLTPIGFSVRQAVNGREATEIWQAWRPHLIWMDLRMPEMDGYEATQWIREQNHCCNEPSAIENRASRTGLNEAGDGRAEAVEGATALPNTNEDQEKPDPIIIAFTASVFLNEQSLTAETGFNDYVLKPFQEEIIWEKLSHHLGVRFVYDQSVESTDKFQKKTIGSGQIQSSDDILSVLQKMPSPWITELRHASCLLRGKQVMQLIEQLPSGEEAIAQKLRDLAENYQFNEIVQLLDTLES